MIALDIAVVAQKVKVQCYIMADMLNLKKRWVTNRSKWLLELLTELRNTALLFCISKFFFAPFFFAVLRSCNAFLQPFHVLISNLDLLRLSMT